MNFTKRTHSLGLRNRTFMKQRQDNIRDILNGTGPQVSEWSVFIQSENSHNIICAFIHSILMLQITTGRQKSIFWSSNTAYSFSYSLNSLSWFQIIGKFWWLPKSCLEPNLISFFFIVYIFFNFILFLNFT